MPEGYWDRLGQKGLEAEFLWELEHGYELSPRESQGILEAVKLIFGQDPEFASGKVRIWVVARQEPAGKPVDELRKVGVWVTVDAGSEDLEVYRRYGLVGLRRARILRISEEVLDGGGVATQEDLARVLQSSVRTIRRDLAYLRSQGYEVVTRGAYCDIGRGVSHKVIVVKKFLEGFTYTEICRQTRHSAKAVKRYVRTFGRVVTLLSRGIVALKEIAFHVGISERLATEYVALYEAVREQRGCQRRIEDLLNQLSSRLGYKGQEKGALA